MRIGGDHRRNPTRGFLDVLRVREFRWLWFADLQSLIGDQLSRVALSVLVFNQTGSGLLTAAVYALTYLPAVLGSVLLGSLADRIPRRALLVGGDLVRAVLLGVMAVPAVPIGAMAALLVVAVVVGTPWKAAEMALVADILDAEGYAIGTGLRMATVQGAQLLGFAVGGIAVASIGSRTALAVDAGSFLLSALMINLRVQRRPAPAKGRNESWSDGVRVIAGDRRLHSLIGLSWLSGVLVIPEGLAAPYAAHLGGGAAATGVLLAAGPAGVLVGSLLYVRLLPDHLRARLVAPLAIVAGLPLVGCVVDPGLAATCVLWALSGAGTAYQVQIITEFVQTVPVSRRGQGISVASAGLLAVQGVGLVLGGLATTFWAPPTVVFAAGGAAIVLATLLGAARSSAHRTPTRVAVSQLSALR
ncbi:MAG: MFS transporter [Actinomycetota bacterium]|nr:MFS transporter [Actinomycetota bacterium]